MNEVLRQEKKFLIGLPQLYRHSHNLRQFMMEDPHNHGLGYPLRSLYFDSLDDRDFEEKENGIELRRKIRLRNYGASSSFAMLEMKQKEGPLQKKTLPFVGPCRRPAALPGRLHRAAKLPGALRPGVLLGYDQPVLSAPVCGGVPANGLYCQRKQNSGNF